MVSKRRQRRKCPPIGSVGFARWVNGPITRLCGHGYHEGGDVGPLRCAGAVSTAGFVSPCECWCHEAVVTSDLAAEQELVS